MTEEAITEAPPKTPTQLLEDALSERYPRDRYALFFDVPDNVGTLSHRRADAIAIGCWASDGHLIHGFELKVSRADWLRERRQVRKADPFIERCDRFWLVTSSTEVAKLEEIPGTWGWFSLTKSGLRMQKLAAPLHKEKGRPVERLFAIALFRKLQENTTGEPAMRRAIEDARKEERQRIEADAQYAAARAERTLEDLREKIRAFEKASGIQIDSWRYGDVRNVAAALAQLGFSAKAFTNVGRQLAAEEREISTLLEHLRAARAALAEYTPPQAIDPEASDGV